MLPDPETLAMIFSVTLVSIRPDPLTVNSPSSVFNSFALTEPEPERAASKLELLPYNSMRPEPDNSASTSSAAKHFCI